MSGLGEMFHPGDAAVLVPCIVTRAPSSLTDDLEVKIESWAEIPRVVAGWMPRGAVLPSVDDEGLAAIDLNGEAWLLVWAPG